MKITLEQLAKADRALARLESAVLPGRLAYQVSKLIRVLKPEFQSYQEAKQKIIDRLGQPSEKMPGMFIPKADCKEEWMQEFEQLHTTEFELVIQIDETILDKISLPAIEMEALEPFIKFGEQKPEG